ncbi:uncharacterized protein BDR25DRAFT_393633 [Lindgomyces ingoldianus]|uniref:Uncharacterized protein n=1 Tax=Lindgomyces ingoldianus TaxID=673940 RepID=A0ACB6QVH9_9PLEO|nr:uncharacterized protein BDR25DRAFT_393633 [Lindgomyces ingoldianus]KAF2471049.1 hypothetical protein BDR25DRAFT_393633 [Lindgomyces ingoldianus]
MVDIPSTAADTASAVLALSKAAWKLGSSLSKLDQDTKTADTTIQNLAGEVKLLGNECDLVYAELEEVVIKRETRSPPPDDVDGRIWNCLATHVEETSRTIQELELLVKSIRGKETSFMGQAQRQRKLDKSKAQVASIRTRICRHTDNLHITLLLINTVLTHIAPRRANRGLVKELDKLHAMIEKLQRSSEANPQSRTSQTEATLMQCAREVIVNGTAMYEASLAAQPFGRSQGAANGSIRVAEWVNTLDSIRLDQRRSDPSEMVSGVPPIFSGGRAHRDRTSATSVQHAEQHEAIDTVGDDSDDDLDTDLAKAALDTGTKAFEAQEWEEADSLLQEALRVLQQLSDQQRSFCDLFGLQYKLAVCAYHIQEPAVAEEALVSLAQQSVSSDEQRGYTYNAAHLLSQLYIRMGQIDHARSECETALQGRRRLLGKQSDAALESTALAAHIYVLLNNRARAKSYLAMIPEARRDAVLKTVEESLDTMVEHLDALSIRTRPISEDLNLAVQRIENRFSASSLLPPIESGGHGSVFAMISPSLAASPLQPHQPIPSYTASVEDLPPVAMPPLPSVKERSGSRADEEHHPASQEPLGNAARSPGETRDVNEASDSKTLSRKEILDRIGCQPRDRIEDAVCDGDHSAFASLLNRKKDFWWSKWRKHARPERITALHFAALFGEIDMAQCLLGSGYNINEIPYGYTTSLHPLKFAIGARQVDMVEFLIAKGAKPTEPDSWSTLAGQLMNRSWLMKTMSEAEKEYVPTQIIAILRTLLRHGWNVNEPFETSGGTVFHQAVTFWTGSYSWDLNLRVTIASFLCERGADPFQTNKEGKTPYDLALTSGHNNLLLVLGRGSEKRVPEREPEELFELSGEPIRSRKHIPS